MRLSGAETSRLKFRRLPSAGKETVPSEMFTFHHLEEPGVDVKRLRSYRRRGPTTWLMKALKGQV